MRSICFPFNCFHLIHASAAVAVYPSLFEHLYTFEKHRLKANIYVGIISYILNEGFIVLRLIVFVERRKNERMNEQERERDKESDHMKFSGKLIKDRMNERAGRRASERASKKRGTNTYTENVVVTETINKMMRIKINCTQYG